MSRIGNQPIEIPSGVEVKVEENNYVTVKGPKGELKEKFDSDFILSIEDNVLTVKRPTEQKRHKSLHGLIRSLVANMVVGVSDGYKKELELIGVGFRAQSTGQNLELNIGYSHPIVIQLPPEIKVEAKMEKGKNPTVYLESNDKQLIGQVAAKIRSFRAPEPYKGKGIRYSDEFIRRKAGKTAAK